jgi:hypothetical protein
MEKNICNGNNVMYLYFYKMEEEILTLTDFAKCGVYKENQKLMY